MTFFHLFWFVLIRFKSSKNSLHWAFVWLELKYWSLLMFKNITILKGKFKVLFRMMWMRFKKKKNRLQVSYWHLHRASALCCMLSIKQDFPMCLTRNGCFIFLFPLLSLIYVEAGLSYIQFCMEDLRWFCARFDKVKRILFGSAYM